MCSELISIVGDVEVTSCEFLCIEGDVYMCVEVINVLSEFIRVYVVNVCCELYVVLSLAYACAC